jgi:hypothetical protein
MQSFPINWWAIIIVAAVKFFLGWLWYSPFLFQKQWTELAGVSEAQMRAGLVQAIIAEIVTDLVMAYILLHAVHYAGAATVLQGAVVGFFNWLGFIATVTLASVFYEKRSWGLWVINNGYLVIALIVMGAILAIWP